MSPSSHNLHTLGCTQSVRSSTSTDIKEIRCHRIGDKCVVRWFDIEQEFPDVQSIWNGKSLVQVVRDSQNYRIQPACIKHHPDTVLVADPTPMTPVLSSIPTLRERPLPSPATFDHTAYSPSPTATVFPPSYRNVTSMTGRPESSSLPPNLQSMFRAIRDEQDGPPLQPEQLRDQLLACLQELQFAMADNKDITERIVKLDADFETGKETVKQEQMKVIKQLSSLQDQVQAALAQKQDPQEYGVPRLFVVFPQSSPEDGRNPNFRLYFLCECGDHTRAPDSKTPHYIHLARHEGYHIRKPNEFFQSYGFYVLTILEMLKHSVSVPGIDVPEVSQLLREDIVDKFTQRLQPLVGNIEMKMDLTIRYLEELGRQSGDTEALQDVNFRELETFLEGTDDSQGLGNLYRTFTAEGQVKWVCREHYRMNRQRTTVSLWNTVNDLGGTFEESAGRVKVSLLSRTQADQLYIALENTKSVSELNLTLSWDTTYNDFKSLRDTLYTTNISVLNFKCHGISNWNRSMLERSRLYDPIFDIMRHSTIQFVTIANEPHNLFRRSTSVSYEQDYPNLKYLDLSSLDMKLDTEDTNHLRCLVAKTPNLSSLLLHTRWKQVPAVYSAIATHQNCPITFRNLSLRILPPSPRQTIVPLQDLTQLFEKHGAQIETCKLDDELDDGVFKAFAEATRMDSSLKELVLHKASSQGVNDDCVTDLARLISQSEIRKLQIDLEDEDERARIFESIQWKNLRQLGIKMGDSNQWARVMEVLEESSKKAGVPIELERLTLEHQNDTFADYEQLLSFVASRSIRHIEVFGVDSWNLL
ncbi:hypothetical protein B0O80DRAFT_495543 [Mortierella sp. GBAus27b]|nr:hypothetical protein BGX31_004011 [Mortierella sp. GBA43]KAI8358885.1 hypothetical protein B0O80DRAFT_495543 [Mortierella sp. GBAus27b]